MLGLGHNRLNTIAPRSPGQMGLVCAGLFLLLGLWTGTAQAQDAGNHTVPVEVYWQQVAEALSTIRTLQGSGEEAVDDALSALAAEFESIAEVELADGRRIPLDSSYLAARLKEPDPDLAQLEAYLTVVQTSRDRWPEPSHDSQDLLPLAEILARPEFQVRQEEPGPLDQLWQRILDSLRELLVAIFPESAGGFAPLIRGLLTVIGIVALVAALVFTLRGILGDIVADEESPLGEYDGLALVNADQALQEAHTYSRRGDYRSAVRYLYISCLLSLEERELLRYDRAQTNQEYLRNVAGKPELADTLRDVIDVFDRVWYGFQSLDEKAFSHYAGRVEQLRQQ